LLHTVNREEIKSTVAALKRTWRGTLSSLAKPMEVTMGTGKRGIEGGNGRLLTKFATSGL